MAIKKRKKAVKKKGPAKRKAPAKASRSYGAKTVRKGMGGAAKAGRTTRSTVRRKRR
jgi:hypothetical protein